MDEQRKIDVFVSYARNDLARVQALADGLQELGLSVFFDIDRIDGGDSFPDVIDRAVKSAGVVVGCWTIPALARAWVKTECLIGLERSVLVPVALDVLRPIDVPAAFYSLDRIDLTSWQQTREHEGWLKLVRAVGNRLRRPELIKRAREAAAVSVGERIGGSRSAEEMTVLWSELEGCLRAKDATGVERIAQTAKGSIVGAVAMSSLADLVRPAAESSASGPGDEWPTKRHGAMIYIAIPLAFAALMLIAATYYFRDSNTGEQPAPTQSFDRFSFLDLTGYANDRIDWLFQLPRGIYPVEGIEMFLLDGSARSALKTSTYDRPNWPSEFDVPVKDASPGVKRIHALLTASWAHLEPNRIGSLDVVYTSGSDTSVELIDGVTIGEGWKYDLDRFGTPPPRRVSGVAWRNVYQEAQDRIPEGEMQQAAKDPAIRKKYKAWGLLDLLSVNVDSSRGIKTIRLRDESARAGLVLVALTIER